MDRNTQAWMGTLLRCQVHPQVAVAWSSVFARVIQPGTFSLGDAELDDFLGQILHESQGLTEFVEHLSYSAERLCVVWPTRFPTLESAQPYARNPEALANKVYGGRMGNTEPGDGWKYRGRLPPMFTGKETYKHVGDLMGLDLVSNPDQLTDPDNVLRASILWWEDRIPDSMIGDIEKVTKRVNGGLIGLADRKHQTDLAREALS